MSPRRLVSVRRRVQAEDHARYDNAWRLYFEAATRAGGRAWRFRATDEERDYLEFLEFAGDDDPRGSIGVAGAWADLEAIAAGAAEEWLEAR